MTRYRILHIYGRMQRGGAEMMTLRLMRHLDPQRFEFHFCVLSGLPGELDEEIRALGGRVIYLRLGPAFPRRFSRLLAEGGYQAVHSHVHMFSGVLLALAAWQGIPRRIVHFHSVVSTTRASRESLLKRIQNRGMRRLLDRYSTDLIAVCQGVRERVWPAWGGYRSVCRVVYNGVRDNDLPFERIRREVKKEFAIPEGHRLFLHVGSMSPAKNHERLLAIFREVVRSDGRSSLLLVGREDEAIGGRLRSVVRDTDLGDQVVFAGERSDVDRLLRAADLMIFPSLWEGMPVSVLEACAASTPVVASDLPGIREIADQLPGTVTCLPLAAGDREWAQTIGEVLRVSTKAEGGSGVIGGTVFSLERQASLLSAIWTGCAHA